MQAIAGWVVKEAVEYARRNASRIGGLVVELVRGQTHDDLVAGAQLSGSPDVFLLRLRTVRLAPFAAEHEESGPTRWRVGGDVHRH